MREIKFYETQQWGRNRAVIFDPQINVKVISVTNRLSHSLQQLYNLADMMQCRFIKVCNPNLEFPSIVDITPFKY